MKSDEILIKTFDQVKNDNFDQVKFDQVIVCHISIELKRSITSTSSKIYRLLAMKYFVLKVNFLKNATFHFLS
jgi:hypothetical protein